MNNQISFQDVYQTIAQRGEFKLGQRASTPDGREWVFAQARIALATGLVAIPAAVTDQDLWSSATDSQGRIVYLSRAASSFTVGQFEDSIGVINQGTGVGQTFKIRTNSATMLTLYPETALTTALAVADSDLQIRTMSVVDPAAITSKLQSAVGTAQVSFAASDYGWLITEGDGRVLAGEVLVIGANFVTGDDTVGQVLKGTTAKGPFDEQSLGFCLVANDAADQGTLVRFEIRG